MSGVIDQYSYLHFASGVTAYFVGIKLRNWILLHLAVDLIENSGWGIKIIKRYLYFIKQPRLGPDPPLNIIADNIFAIIGWYSAKYLDRYCRCRDIGGPRSKLRYLNGE